MKHFGKISVVLCFIGVLFAVPGYAESVSRENAGKLYWFIPDGVRAEPDLFTIYEWARQGKLPNIKKMMDNGAYGYCVPVFPSHTPVNFASLLTGSYPKTHGVADGPMHIEGRPLDKVSIGGFSSVAKKVPPIWVDLEKNNKKVVLLSIPGSTPPELEQGVTIRGRWGGWGADFHALNFQTQDKSSDSKKQGRSARLFFFGPELTMYVDVKSAEGWSNMPVSLSRPLEATMKGWGTDIFAYIYDSRDDNSVNFDRVAFSVNKQSVVADLVQGQWSQWNPIQLKWQNLNIATDFKIKLIKLQNIDTADKVFFRIRYFYNNLNRHISRPSEISDEILGETGPMVDFADNFPAQLVSYAEDKQTFLEEAEMSFDWHARAASLILGKYQPDVFIHDIYTPNQMLSSRWWLGFIDPKSQRYKTVAEDQRKQLWDEVLTMYKRLDDILGEYLKKADNNTMIVFSSDHGVAPLNKFVHLNNLFAKEGLLKFTLNEKTGEPVIDWERTSVIYLNMYNIYIHPRGLGGKWTRASGQEYEALRNRVIAMLNDLKDENGQKPVAAVVKWEDAEKTYHLPQDRVGDLTVANQEGFGWNEEVGPELGIFSTPLISGYKQGILPDRTKSVWTPFIIMGPGVKKNYEIKNPIQMVDQYPTIMHLLGMKIPEFVEGKILKEIYEDK